MKVVKKLSMKTIVGSKADILTAAMTGRENDKAPVGKPVTIARMMGIATKIQTGETDNGPWVAIIGTHKAINVFTGDEVRSSKAFLPAPADDMIAAQLAMEGVDSVEYAIDVNVHYDESAITSYVYGVEVLQEPTENDPLNALEKTLGLPGLPAPVQLSEEQKAAAAKETKAKEDAEAKEAAKKEKAK